MKIVVDTNIIFSCLLNTNNSIGDLIFNSEDIFEFYSCDYMRVEIHKHWTKLKRISNLSETNLQNSFDKTLTRIQFINEDLIKTSIWLKAEEIVNQIDLDDIDFVALTRYLKGALWTGDKKLHDGLKAQKFRKIYNTIELIKLRNKLSKI
jgi:predicted nucleic acid-binding protein